MPHDLANLDLQIQQKIKRWEGYRQQLLADPEYAEFLSNLLTQSSNGNPATRHSVPLVPSSTKLVLTHLVLAAINGSDDLLTVDEVYDQIKDSGYEFGADPRDAVGKALRSMVRQGKIRVARKGSGTKPHRYGRLNKETAKETSTVAA